MEHEFPANNVNPVMRLGTTVSLPLVERILQSAALAFGHKSYFGVLTAE